MNLSFFYNGAVLAFSFSFFASGCASSLVVHGPDGAEAKGVPVKTAEVYVMTGTNTKSTTVGDKCDKSPFVQYVPLPTGAQYYIAPKSDFLASTEFSLGFTDQGALKTVTLNSEPAASDTLDSVAGLATDVVFPLLGLGSGSSDDDVASVSPTRVSGVSGNQPACDTGPDAASLKVIKLDEFLKKNTASVTH